MIFDWLKKQGTHGRIEIPSLRISAPLYDSTGNAQEIIDRKNSAAFIKWHDQNVIVDHSNQDGFERLAKAIPYKTLAYIDYKGRDSYLCVKKQIGHLIIGETNKLLDADWKPAKSGGLLMYSCKNKSAENVMDVWLTYWKLTRI